MSRLTRANSPTRAKDVLYRSSASTHNVTDSSLARFQAALAAAVTSAAPAQILCLGDSITQGVTSTPQQSFNWPKRLRDTLTASGRFGTVGEGAAFPTSQTLASYDTRWTLGTGFSLQNGGLLLHSMFQAAPGSGALSFGPVTCDTFVIYYTRHSINGTWTWNVDGGTATGVNANGATGVFSTVFSAGSLGSHTLNITSHATVGYCMILGVGFYNSAARNQLEVLTGGGTSGITSAGLVGGQGGGFGNLDTVALVNPALTCILVGRNDASYVNGVTPAQFKGNVSTLVKQQRAAGKDVLLITPPPAQPSSYLLNSAVLTALYQLADEQNVALLDLTKHFGPNWNAAPYSMSTDNIHPNDAGSVAIGRTVANLILNL